MSEKPTDLFGTISIADKETATPSSGTGSRRKRRGSRPEKQPASPIRKPQRSGERSGLWRWWLSIAVFIMALYCAAGFLLVPYLVKAMLPGYLHDQTGTVLSIESVRFNPFTFHLESERAALYGPKTDTAAERLLGIAHLTADLDPLSLLRGDLVCSSLSVDGLDLQIVRREDKTYNIAPLLRGKTAASTTGIMDFAELPFLFALNNISINNSRVTIEDRHDGKEHLIDHIQITLPAIANFSYQGKTYLQPRFSAVVNGSPVTLSGETAVSKGDGATQINVDLNDINIPLYSDYLPVGLPLRCSGGTANGKLQISFSDSPTKGNRLQIKFDLTTSAVTIASRDEKLSVTIPQATIEGSFEPLSRSLALNNVLLREPAIVSSGEISRDTLAALLPMTRRPAADSTLFQAIPGLRIKLLIADGASFSTMSSGKKAVQSWHDIQLSIRDFSNEAPAKQGDTPPGTFRISGQDAQSSAAFTWQGTFSDINQPSGTLQLDTMPAARVAPFLGKTPKDISGTIGLNGQLSISLGSEQGETLAYLLENATINIKELQLKDRGVVWLRTPNMRCEPVNRKGGVTDLGNVFLPNSTVVMERSQLPHLFGLFASKPEEFILHGFDFSGTIKILDDKAKATLLDLRDVVFQANKLEQKEKNDENFVFSAIQRENGSIRAKGNLRIVPVTVTAQLAITDVEPRQLIAWFSDSQTLLSSRARMSATGSFRYPAQEFTGELHGRDILIGSEASPVLRAANLDLKGFDWSAGKRRLGIKELTIDKPVIPWQRAAGDENPAELAAIFLRHMLLPEKAPVKQSGDKIDTFSLEIGEMSWKDGIIHYLDRRVTPQLKLEVAALTGSLKRLTFPAVEQNAAFQMRGAIEGQPFTVEGEGRLLQKPASVTAGFVAQSLPLRLFAAQIYERVKDIKIDKATAQVSFSASWQGAQGREQADVTIRGATPTRSSTPISVSLALISDQDGRTSYRSDNDVISEAGVLNETINHYGTLFVKAAINPLLITGQSFKDLVDQQFAEFQPGTAVLTGASLERLNRYSELLSAHPLISLLLIGRAEQKNDRAVLLAELQRQEAQRVDQENRRRAEQWRQQQEQRQPQKSAGQGGVIQEKEVKQADVTFMPETPRDVTVTPQLLLELAAKREQTVSDYLVNQLGIDAKRIVISGKPDSKTTIDDGPARVDLRLADMYGISDKKKQ